MTLGERCDEIVRLIDETLEDCAQTTPAPAAATRLERPADAADRPVAGARKLAGSTRDRLPRSA